MPEGHETGRGPRSEPSPGDGPPATRAFFLGQFPDDPHDARARPSPAAPVGFDSAVEEAEQHLDRLAASVAAYPDNGETARVRQPERPSETGVDETDHAATVPSARARRTQRRRVVRRRRHVRRARIAAVVTVVAVLFASTALYLRTQAKAEDKRARRPTSTSIEQPSTTAADTAPSDATPSTESAAAPVVPGASPSAPRGTSRSRSPGPTTLSPTESTSAPAPGSASAPPTNTSPTTAPPRSPTCQLLPVLCP
jgi:hypothetical protein